MSEPSYTDPVKCARSADLNCPNTHPAHKFGTIRANEEGWFHPKEGEPYCPDHVPDWVAGWRARQEARKRQVSVTLGNLPVILKCEQGDMADVWQPEDDDDKHAALLRQIRDQAQAHFRETGHQVTVIDARVFTVTSGD